MEGPEFDIYALGLVFAEALTRCKFGEPPTHLTRHTAFVDGVRAAVFSALREPGEARLLRMMVTAKEPAILEWSIF